VLIERVMIANYSTDQNDGGEIYAIASSITIEKSYFSDCQANGQEGQAIYLELRGPTSQKLYGTIHFCTIIRSLPKKSERRFQVDGGRDSVDLTGSREKDCELRLDACNFSRNEEHERGAIGELDWSKDLIMITFNTFEDCSHYSGSGDVGLLDAQGCNSIWVEYNNFVRCVALGSYRYLSTLGNFEVLIQCD
jgi:hypothetical protein